MLESPLSGGPKVKRWITEQPVALGVRLNVACRPSEVVALKPVQANTTPAPSPSGTAEGQKPSPAPGSHNPPVAFALLKAKTVGSHRRCRLKPTYEFGTVPVVLTWNWTFPLTSEGAPTVRVGPSGPRGPACACDRT